jgi:hypothetical protein
MFLLFFALEAQLNLLESGPRKECMDKITEYCPNYKDNTFHKCIATNFKNLKNACSFLLEGIEVPSDSESFLEACQDDVYKYCTNLKDIEGCLKKSLKDFSKKCREKLDKIVEAKQKKILDACKEDLKGCGTDIEKCLASKELSAQCKIELNELR